MSAALKGRIALVTGASRGIGAAVAKRFAAEGAHVIITARNLAGLEAVDDEIQKITGEPSTIVPFDITQFDKIDALASNIAQRFGKLDILVGNAGVLGGLRPLPSITEKIWNEVMAVNLTANWRLVRAFDPLLRLSDAGRVMFVTSGVTQNVNPYWGPYTISKVALESLANTYAAEVATTKIKVNLIDPGVVRTQMRAQAIPGEDPSTLPEPESITDIFVELASDKINFSAKRKAA